jgi:enamine deaminase RidA (YjgF/YER057c/UK114 family)
MTDPILARLDDLGLTPAPATTPPEWFEPVAVHGRYAYLAGQVPFGPDGGLLATGRLGDGISLEGAVACARQCAANGLATLSRALGGLDRIERIVKVTVFVSSAPGFAEQPVVANGASEVLFAVLGDAGRHARSAVGVASLPLDCPVEVELVAALRSTAA